MPDGEDDLSGWIFCTSLKMRGSMRGFIGCYFYLKGFTLGFRGMVCVMMEVSKVFKSLYPQAITSMYSFKILMISSLSTSLQALLMKTIFSYPSGLILCGSYYLAFDSVVSFSFTIGSESKRHSRVTIPLGLTFKVRFMIPPPSSSLQTSSFSSSSII